MSAMVIEGRGGIKRRGRCRERESFGACRLRRKIASRSCHGGVVFFRRSGPGILRKHSHFFCYPFVISVGIAVRGCARKHLDTPAAGCRRPSRVRDLEYEYAKVPLNSVRLDAYMSAIRRFLVDLRSFSFCRQEKQRVTHEATNGSRKCA